MQIFQEESVPTGRQVSAASSLLTFGVVDLALHHVSPPGPLQRHGVWRASDLRPPRSGDPQAGSSPTKPVSLFLASWRETNEGSRMGLAGALTGLDVASRADPALGTSVPFRLDA